MWRILALVDRKLLRNQLQKSIGDGNREIEFAENLDSAITKLGSEIFHLIVADEDLLNESPDLLATAIGTSAMRVIPVLLLTQFRKGHTKLNLEGVQNWTCVKKPLNKKILRNTTLTLLEQVRFPNFVNYLRHKEKYIYRLNSIIAVSQSMRTVMDLAEKVSASNSTVLITGDHGTGKETIAAAIHFNSTRKDENFVVVKCGLRSYKQMEDELFGHNIGESFGGRDRVGRIEQANAGTLFLKDIDRLNQTTQAKILRVIQQKEFERLDGKRKVKVDVRLICSSTRDLKDGINSGEFREDLFYRINVINIQMPPLYKRKEDIPSLAQFFLHKYRYEFGKPEVDFSPKAIGTMMEYDWPGNVSELENVVQRALMISSDNVINSEDLLLFRRSPNRAPARSFAKSDNLNLDHLERAAIVEALNRAKGVQKDAADILGISPRVIHYKIQKHGINE